MLFPWSHWVVLAFCSTRPMPLTIGQTATPTCRSFWDGRLAAIDMDRKVGGCCAPFRGGPESPSNTMSSGPMLPPYQVAPTIWPQYTNVTDRQDRQDRANRYLYQSPKNDDSKLYLHVPGTGTWTLHRSVYELIDSQYNIDYFRYLRIYSFTSIAGISKQSNTESPVMPECDFKPQPYKVSTLPLFSFSRRSFMQNPYMHERNVFCACYRHM